MRNISTTAIEFKLIEYVFDRYACPQCGAESKRNTIGHRMLKDLSLEQPVLLVITMGVYECPRGCRPKYFRISPAIAERRSAYTDRVKETAIASVAEDKMSFCGVGQRMERDFQLHPSTSSVWRWCLREWEEIDIAQDYEPWVVKSFSGVLCVDEVYDGALCLILLRDGLNEHTLYQEVHKKDGDQGKKFCQSEYLEQAFDYIKKLGLVVEVVISDGDPLYPQLIEQKFPEARQQRCHFHVLQDITPCVVQAVAAYSRQLKAKSKLPRRRPRKEERERVERVKKLQAAAKEIQRDKYLFVTRPEHLAKTDRRNPDQTPQQRLDQILREHPALAIFREFMLDLFALLAHEQSQQQAREKYQALMTRADYRSQVNLAKALSYLSVETFERMMTFLDYENLDRTNNCAERGGRRFRQIQNSHYRLRRTRSLRAWLKADRIQEINREEKSRVEPKHLQLRQGEEERKAA